MTVNTYSNNVRSSYLKKAVDGFDRVEHDEQQETIQTQGRHHKRPWTVYRKVNIQI